MTKDNSEVTKQGAVELTEDSLDQISGGKCADSGTPFPKFSAGDEISLTLSSASIKLSPDATSAVGKI